MATYLTGISNIILNGCRDTSIFDEWLNKLNQHFPEYKWKYDLIGFGSGGEFDDSPDPDSIPFQVRFSGPTMFHLEISDKIAVIDSNKVLDFLFNQEPSVLFDLFINDIHKALTILGGTELIWLAEFGSSSIYATIFQNHVWKQKTYDQVKNVLLQEIGKPVSYLEIKNFYDNDRSIWGYHNIDRFVLAKTKTKSTAERMFQIPPIEEIKSIGIIPFQNSQNWGSVHLDYLSSGKTVQRLTLFHHGKLKIGWTSNCMEYDYRFDRNGIGIIASSSEDVKNGKYDHIKITTKNYQPHIGKVSDIFNRLVNHEE